MSSFGNNNILMLCICAALAGCSAQDDTAAEPASVAGIDQLPPGWTSIESGGETSCSDGSPYRFFARPGNPQKLMVFFQGGGACWTRQTCDPAGQPTYTVNIAENYTPYPFGVFNFDNPDNPFSDYSVVFAPYCTGDVHLGAKDAVYLGEPESEAPLTVRHRGRANAQAVLDWTYANVPAPTDVFVTGSSAGAIPSPFYAALVANAYPEARVAQLGDGAGGYRRDNGGARPDEQWGTFEFLTKEPGFAEVSAANFNFEQLYIAAAKAHPEILFAAYDAAEDAVQKRFLAIGGIKGVALMDTLTANHRDIIAAVPNFRAFVTGGTSHTVLRRPEFYAYGAGGTSVRDWVAGLAAYQPTVDVACAVCDQDTYAGPPMPDAMRALWQDWEDPRKQYVEPFQIFDNVYYVGIDWVAAYIIETSEGLILVDSLYGKWVPALVGNITKLGLDPRDIKYVINTHGHFDHAGGSAFFQAAYGAQVVMAEEDWQLAAAQPELAAFYMPAPKPGIVAADGDVITLGDTSVELFKTPGHTEGVLTLRYQVRDGSQQHTAITLGGVGLNFSGVERTETYIDSYQRLQGMAQGVSVSLPNHAAMANVFGRAQALKARAPGAPHPFVDEESFKTSLATFIAGAKSKLEAEKAGTAKDPLEELSNVLDAR